MELVDLLAPAHADADHLVAERTVNVFTSTLEGRVVGRVHRVHFDGARVTAVQAVHLHVSRLVSLLLLLLLLPLLELLPVILLLLRLSVVVRFLLVPVPTVPRMM